jgi:UDP-N-acetylmuramyl pentapeptide phosphotransferase/UDP-N-acetylglucosamine-1-phosphate transferase
MSDTVLWPGTTTVALSFALVSLVRRLAVRHGVLDHPTERSSHAVVTPRGGGLGLLLAVLAVSAWRATHPLSWTLVALLFAASVVGLVGWIDDRRGLSVGARLVVHVVAGATVGAAATGIADYPALALMLFAAWTFWTVSSINLVNFMDGINGLVASQIAIFAGALAIVPDGTGRAAFVEITVAAACIGFLPWNFPRARIFLGDVGSGALGFFVPMLALLALEAQGVDILRAHLPLLPLFGDAAATIVRRWRRGERLTEAHRSHLYQRLANGPLTHATVTVIYAAVSLCGAVAAHAASSPDGTKWIPLYVLLTLVLGFTLDRYAQSRTRAPA